MRKFKTSSRIIFVLVAFLTLSTIAFSQIETNAVAARWEYYTGQDKKVSFFLPRMPVYIAGGDNCSGESIETYAAYTDGVVYRVDITTKVEPRRTCRPLKPFDETNFKRKLAALKSDLKEAPSESGNNISANSVIKLTGENRIVKLINDYENGRWYEFSVYGADETKPEVVNFLDSLKKDATPKGIEIGPGAPQTFGDEVAKTDARVLSNIIGNGKEKIEESFTDITIKTKETIPAKLKVILRPRANYTEEARGKMVQGRVVLAVIFMANGAIGKIHVISGLPNGLTQEAIKAAQKMVFIPEREAGERLTVSKMVEYGFSIY
jgi:hypothetical protein